LAFSALAGSALLDAVAPTQNTNGSQVVGPLTYRLFWGCSSPGTYPSSASIAAFPYTVEGLPDVGTCYFAATAVDALARESALSNQASKLMGVLALPDVPTSPPTITWSQGQIVAVLDSDDFNRIDNTDLGSEWDVCTGESGSTGLEIVSNTARGTKDAILDSSETFNATAAPNDGYSQVTYGATTAAGAGAGMGPTYRAATGATKTYYRAIGNASGWEMGKKVAGTFTSLGTGTGTTFTAGDTLRLTLSGTGWSLSKNGAADFASGTDSSISSGRAGIAYSSTDGGTTVTAWEMGDTGGGGAVLGIAPIVQNYRHMGLMQ
jgi:hypothetical protein